MRDDLMEFFNRRIQSKRQEKPRGVPAEVAQCFFASATIGVTYFWLDAGMKHPASQISRWFRLIAFKSYIGAIAGVE